MGLISDRVSSTTYWDNLLTSCLSDLDGVGSSEERGWVLAPFRLTLSQFPPEGSESSGPKSGTETVRKRYPETRSLVEKLGNEGVDVLPLLSSEMKYLDNTPNSLY